MSEKISEVIKEIIIKTIDLEKVRIILFEKLLIQFKEFGKQRRRIRGMYLSELLDEFVTMHGPFWTHDNDAYGALEYFQMQRFW